MKKEFAKKYFAIICFPLVLCSCSINTKYSEHFYCENIFNLMGDVKHKFPEQKDYMTFISKSYFETFIENQRCHYYIKFNSGEEIDTWGTYVLDGSAFIMNFESGLIKTPYFSYYYSTTIDFQIIDTLNYDGYEYKVIYNARYLYSTKG